MKLITNWRSATVADSEADALLEEATRIHVLSYKLSKKKVKSIKGTDKGRLKAFFNYHIDNSIPIVMHNGICFDTPLMEKLLGINLSNLMLIDTLPLSWYLNTKRERHGLDSFFEDYGIKKPKIDDWDNLSYEEYANRCQEDVKINVALWEDFKERLEELYSNAKRLIDSGKVGGKRTSNSEKIYLDNFVGTSTVDEYIDRILTFLMFKADITRLKEATKCYMDKDALIKFEDKLTLELDIARDELEAVMPKVPKYGSTISKPKKPYKKDGTLSVAGQKWLDIQPKIGTVDSNGNEVIKVLEGGDKLEILTEYEDPNIASPDQVKKFLFSKGWKPRTFKYVKDKEAMDTWAAGGFKRGQKPKARAIPQISKDGDDGKELCSSVLDLADKVPEVMALAKYSTIKHRRDTAKGFLKTMGDGDTLQASTGGYTNTLREKHRNVVNLVGVSKPYGKDIRGAFIAKKGFVLLGSDLSSLEDRVKHHFMLPHDPTYVETMLANDYDSHILMALTAGMITEEQFLEFKKGDKTPEVALARHAGKQTNYAAVYNSGAETLSLTSGIPQSKCKDLLEAYWKLNWSVKTIADEQVTFKDSSGGSWLVNPINGFCYSLRKESDRFSTLCQGTGSFFFDMWVDNILDLMLEGFGVKRLSLTMHDEYMMMFRDTLANREKMESITYKAIEMVNDKYLLRRKLGCDVQFGYKYSEIH